MAEKKETKFTQPPKDDKKRKQVDDERTLRANCWKDFMAAQAARKKYDWEWVTRDLFIRGYQFARYSPNTQTFVMAGRTKVRIPINLTYAQMRSVKNQVTNFQPKWEVLPRNIDDKSKWNAHCSGRLLDYLFEELKLRRKVKEAVIHGLKFSVGIWQVGWDDMVDNGDEPKGQVFVEVIDPFDLFIDPNATSLDDATFVIKAVRKPIAEIKANKHYENTDKLGKSKELAASEYKAFLMQAVKNYEQTPTAESEYTIIYEMWRREWKDGKQKMRVITFVKGSDKILRDETYDRTNYPFYIYSADINPLEIYGEGWAKHVIALNRVINALEGGVFEYNHIFGKGRFVIDRNSGVRMISNQHGQIIEKNRGAEVTSLNLTPLPNAPFAQLGNFQSYIQDIGGAHDICVSDDSEALTKVGWKHKSELEVGEDIFTINPETLVGEWNKIRKLHEYEKDNEELFKIENKNISALVTNNHRWLVKTEKRDGAGGHNEVYEFRTTEHLNGNCSIPLSSTSSVGTPPIYSDDFVELVGWVITEGCYSLGPVNEARGRRRIRISQTYHANPVQWRMIDSLLKRLGVNTTPQLQKDGCTQFSFSGELAGQMRELFPDKILTYDFVNKLTKQQLTILLETMILADGSVERGVYYSTEKRNVDVFQMICVLLGYNARMFVYKDRKRTPILRGTAKPKDMYAVSVKSHTNFTGFSSHERRDKFVTKENYTGIVWCPETENSTWLMRRDGKVCFTGNSLGRAPTGIKSGVGIAQLRQNDAMNQADLVDNLEDFLVAIGTAILKEAAENYQASRIIDITGKGGELEYFVALGENAKQPEKGKLKKGESDLPVATIGKTNRVRVTIGSWLNQTLGAKQERLEALYTAGAVDQQTLLEHLEFGDVEGIIERTREDKMAGVGPITPGVTGKGTGGAEGPAPQGQATAPQGAPAPQMPPMPQPEGMPPAGPAPMGGGQPPMDQGMLAEAENQAMLQGKFDVVIVDPGDDHQLHIQIHEQIVGQVPDAQRHIDEHQMAMSGGM